MNRKDIPRILELNNLRNQSLVVPYDPESGLGATGPRATDDRHPVNIIPHDTLLPVSMLADPEYKRIKTVTDYKLLRFRHDFEFWAVTCVKIKDKNTGALIPFRLNAPQRKLLALMENQRRAGKPVRIILLKARQWGGSTLVQIYMAWIQTVLTRNCHSLICAHVKDTAATIRGIYSRLLENYPETLWEGDKSPAFRPYERSQNTRIIEGRGCCVTLGTSERPEAVRGNDFALAHLSEVAFWNYTPTATPEQFIRAVCGSINAVCGTLIVHESTANGMGNYFHREWLRASEGKSDKTPIFIPWHEIEIYRRKVDDPVNLINSMDDYEWRLWESGLTLEMINWYHHKRREYTSDVQMHAEYPTDPTEAFASTGRAIFSIDKLDVLRSGVRQPQFRGEVTGRAVVGPDSLSGLHFVEDSLGKLEVWEKPSVKSDITDRYVVAVDIGGRSHSADYSVIAVFDRAPLIRGGKVTVVAQWRGHADHDIIAWRSAAIARWYGNALLVIESNTLECDNIGGDPSLCVLNEIQQTYSNLYYRRDPETGNTRVGFHTNRATKTMIVNKLLAYVRDNMYIERSAEAIAEMAVFEDRGTSFGAVEGNHDDIVMTRALGLFVADSMSVVHASDFDGLRLR
ncbi:MAG: hypothetical protein K2M07_02050 [Muribaculaceae bacterium]|nr:hypothetical protein [Muribaculaceae bacterium]